MTAFSLMASANTSHHLNYHYGFYSSLTFFVWVGVFGFLLALFILAAKFVTIVTHEIRDAIEIYGTGTMLWACYTAAVAASATSSNLHTTFDQNEGSWCSPRHHTGRLMAGAYFCSRMVAAIVIMYILVASYAASLFTLLQEADPSSRGYTRTATSSHGGYDDIGETVAMTQMSSPSSSSDSP
eukprot:CAMPEP_0197291820 /NCGR_PEP_ID=MMETSP0890-20130614/19239_1 /TAXON_ID=44058 ORGANISM="Aureoumbra lagunensis, Strain CCMP1510" /NCGR_SAMPLE_ID=MMETSP0890 /ASSEMBLY_ACC=CAM_ASM_000533 /LENGTH=182 /DNA_ID=CAMNT_0042765231 /DNA_START=56 /DNA_END=604 /DNA_ORIENTATION=+